MIPEPQKTYILELLKALGPAGNDFVVAGAQAMKFMLKAARATRDIDFVLDVMHLREGRMPVGEHLANLGYRVVQGSENFQFEKPIPDSHEIMRIEFMAPEEFKRQNNFRVDVDRDVHARACTGGSIALAESGLERLSGRLPSGSEFTASLRVTRAHALVMLKLLALDDRYRNLRGATQSRHDREEARTHAADIIAVVTAQLDPRQFRQDFQRQFNHDGALASRVMNILEGYFRTDTSPGLLAYEEFLVADLPFDRQSSGKARQEVERAHQTMLLVMP